MIELQNCLEKRKSAWKQSFGFLDIFQGFNDPRSTRNLLYSMGEILLTALCSAICGAEGWQDVEDLGNAKLDYLRQHLPFKNGILSDDTFRCFFRALDSEQFQTLFRQWMRIIQPQIEEGVIAIDGKSSRHTFDDDKKRLHMISIYATEARLVLAQEKVAEKSNEMTAIPTLLNWLDLKGNIVTIDAMGCQYGIADKIVSKQGNYIFSLKGNQGTLNDDVRTYLSDDTVISALVPYVHNDKGHGRIEMRSCWVSQDVSWLRSLEIRSQYCAH